MQISREQLEANRNKSNIYGYKKTYCGFQNSCEDCDKKVRFWCKVILKIEDIQTKRILKICK